MEREVKRVLVLCNALSTRGRIVMIVKGLGYNVIKVGNNIESLESLRKSGVADLVIIGQHANAGIIIQWIEQNCSGVPIVFVGGCECASEKKYHTYNEIDSAALEKDLPALINELIGPAEPLK